MTTFILSKEQFTQYNARFISTAHAKNLTAGDMLLNNILRNKDIRRGFTPITNPVKLNHGANEWQGFDAARSELRHSLRWVSGIESYKTKFGLELTTEMIIAIQAALEA